MCGAPKAQIQNPKPKTCLPSSNLLKEFNIIPYMTYEYLIKRLLPFSLGFLAAVFVTSLFQAFGYLGHTADVPEVTGTSHSKPYNCRMKMRGYGSGFGSGSGSGTGSGIGSGSGSGSGIGAGSSSSSEEKLRILHKPAPQYTEEARANGTEGVVRLRVTFLANGEIGSVEPLNDLGDGLTEQAVAAARMLQFEPASLEGRPASVTKTVEYTFSIH